MTRHLEDFFDMPPIPDGSSKDVSMAEALEMARLDEDKIHELDATTDKIDSALPSVRDLATSDKELDTLADLAIDHFKELMDLGMNIEPRLASEIFGSASNLMGHAISAKTAKIDNKLKIVQLQIQKARLDFQKEKFTPAEEEQGEAQELDRNALLAEILNVKKEMSPE